LFGGRQILKSPSNLQLLNSELRNRLFSGLGCYDIDIENAHYSLLYEWLLKEEFDGVNGKIRYGYLREYVINRNEVLACCFIIKPNRSSSNFSLLFCFFFLFFLLALLIIVCDFNMLNLIFIL
jgi:hypothetical protein